MNISSSLPLGKHFERMADTYKIESIGWSTGLDCYSSSYDPAGEDPRMSEIARPKAA